jgi:hypothetical protein
LDVLLGSDSEEFPVGVCHPVDILQWGHAKDSIFISEVVTSKVVYDWAGPFQFEVYWLTGEGVDDGLGVLGSYQQIIDIYCQI